MVGEGYSEFELGADWAFFDFDGLDFLAALGAASAS